MRRFLASPIGPGSVPSARSGGTEKPYPATCTQDPMGSQPGMPGALRWKDMQREPRPSSLPEDMKSAVEFAETAAVVCFLFLC